MPHRKLIRNSTQIEGMRKASQVTKAVLDELSNLIKPGISTEEIDKFVFNFLATHNATPATLNYKGFPKSCCTSVNEVICHGIPSDDHILVEGDIINVDVTSILDGYFGDACRMYPVGKISEAAQDLVDTAKTCLDLAIAAVKPFEPINVIGNAIEAHATPKGYSVVTEFGGHGICDTFHDDPFVLHYSTKEKQMIAVPGMTFTIEPMINEGTYKAEILEDGWTAVTKDRKLSAQWEHTIVVTETGAEPLTA